MSLKAQLASVNKMIADAQKLKTNLEIQVAALAQRDPAFKVIHDKLKANPGMWPGTLYDRTRNTLSTRTGRPLAWSTVMQYRYLARSVITKTAKA